MYTFKATCLRSTQSPGGTHSAVLQGADGSEITIPSKDLMFEAGVEYSISVDGKFAKSAAPAPKPVAPAPVAAKPFVPAPVPAKPVAPVVQPVVAPKKP